MDDIASDKPLKLGQTLLGTQHSNAYYTYKYDFQPESMQRATHADLLLFGEREEQVKLIPELPSGDAPYHFEGNAENLQQRQGADTECVAIFDGNEWTLQLVAGHLRAKHRSGVPLIAGYNVEPAEQEQPAAAAPAEAAGSSYQVTDDQPDAHEIDQDLNDALDEALFAADLNADEGAAAAAPAAQQQQPQQSQQSQPQQAEPTHRQQQQQAPPPPPPQQQQQQQQQQQHRGPQQECSEDESDDDDDPWNTFTAAPAPVPVQAPSQPKPASMPAAWPPAAAAAAAPRPAAVAAPPPAAAPAPAAVPAAAPVGVRVGVVGVGMEEEEEEDNSEAVQECSEDESDGVGVEVF